MIGKKEFTATLMSICGHGCVYDQEHLSVHGPSLVYGGFTAMDEGFTANMILWRVYGVHEGFIVVNSWILWTICLIEGWKVSIANGYKVVEEILTILEAFRVFTTTKNKCVFLVKSMKIWRSKSKELDSWMKSKGFTWMWMIWTNNERNTYNFEERRKFSWWYLRENECSRLEDVRKEGKTEELHT